MTFFSRFVSRTKEGKEEYMPRFDGVRERIYRQLFDTISGGTLPERLHFFNSPERIGTPVSNLEDSGWLMGDQTAQFVGATVSLMAERFTKKFGHLLQQAQLEPMLGAKTYTPHPLRAAPIADSAQAAYFEVFFGTSSKLDSNKPAVRDMVKELGWKREPLSEAELLAAEGRALILPARMGFRVDLLVPDGFRAEWAALEGPKALRVTLHAVVTRDVQ